MRFEYTCYKNKVPDTFIKLGCREFNLDIPIEKGFRSAKKRALVIISQIPSVDLKEHRLLSSVESQQAMENLLTDARKWASNFGTPNSYSFAFINFNFFKTYHLKSSTYKAALQLKVDRIKKYAQKLDVDTILILGDEAFSALIKTQNSGIKHGHIFRLKLGDKKVKVVHTIEWDYLLPSDRATRVQVDYSNLFGYCSRALASAFLGFKPLSLSKIVPKYKFIQSLEKFDSLMDKLMSFEGPIAVDTETESLSVWDNRVLTVQFSTSPTLSYIVPVYHKDTPWTGKQLKHVLSRLKEFFAKPVVLDPENPQYLVMANGSFDLRILRWNLRIPYIYWPIFDCLGGDFCLDENLDPLKLLTNGAYSKIGVWSLQAISTRNGNTWYEDAEFSKSNRATIKDVELTPDVLNYCAQDSQLTLANHLVQLATSEHLQFPGEKNYKKKYLMFMLYQISNMVHDISQMESRGNDLDIKYLLHIASKSKSPIFKLKSEIEKELYSMPSVIKANKRLNKRTGAPKKGLFGSTKDSWIFNINKPAHKQLLFIDILDLEGERGKSGDVGLGKEWQEQNTHVPEVALLNRLGKIGILYNTFAKGIARRASVDIDHQHDGRLRPGYGYLGVVTGRSNSYSPSLQQIPERSKEAKIIKRMFAAKSGIIHVKYDYSAHEVRGWGIISEDPIVAQTFNNIHDILNAFRKKPTEKRRIKLELEGDVHRQNYSSFTGVPIAKVTKDQRQDSKGIGFGAIYGMSAASMGRNLGKTKEQAQKLMDNFFSKFKKAGKWLRGIAEFAQKHGYAYAPTGRRRNLSGYRLDSRKLSGDLDRRASNSPIQGMASDIAFNASRLLEYHLLKMWLHLKRPVDRPMLDCGVMQMVHDSTKAECRYSDVLLVVWIMEWCATIGVQEQIERYLGLKFNTDLAIEFEVGTVGDSFRKWDWTYSGMIQIVRSSLEDARSILGQSMDTEYELREIYKYGRSHYDWLMKHYPLKHTPFSKDPIEGEFDLISKEKSK